MRVCEHFQVLLFAECFNGINGYSSEGTSIVAEKISSYIDEFFLPWDLSEGCSGCLICLNKSREFCPRSEKVEPILSSMLSSDVIIIGSPTYVMEMTSHLKGFFEIYIGHGWATDQRKKCFQK